MFHYFYQILESEVLVQIHYKLRENVSSLKKEQSFHILENLKQVLLLNQILHQKVDLLFVKSLNFVLKLQFIFMIDHFFEFYFFVDVSYEINVYLLQKSNHFSDFENLNRQFDSQEIGHFDLVKNQPTHPIVIHASAFLVYLNKKLRKRI